MSQIVFKIKNTNPNLTVFVDGIRVEGVENTGDFTLAYKKALANIGMVLKLIRKTDNSWGTWNIVYNPKEAERISYNADITDNGRGALVGSKEAPVQDLTVKTDNSYKGLLLFAADFESVDYKYG